MGQKPGTLWVCDRDGCGHVWYSAEKPKRCSKCKSPSWDSKAALRAPVVHRKTGATLGKRRTVSAHRRAPLVQPVVDFQMRAAGDDSAEVELPALSFSEMTGAVENMQPDGAPLVHHEKPVGKCDEGNDDRHIVVDEFCEGYRPPQPAVAPQSTLAWTPEPKLNGFDEAVDDEPLADKLRRLGVTRGMPGE